ncbi:hypothetical protein [Dryocola clanedunensis]
MNLLLSGVLMNCLQTNKIGMRKACLNWQSINVKFVLLIAIFVSGCQAACAACTWVSGASATTVSVNLGTVTVPPSTSVGNIVATQTVPTNKAGETVFATGCVNGSDFGSWLAVNAVPASGFTRVYQTSVAGVGISVQAGTSTIYYQNPQSTVVSGNSRWAYSSWGTSFVVSLVKTGNIPNNGDIGARTFRMSLSGVGTVLTLNITGGTIISPSCTVTNPNITVPLNDHQQK